MSHVEPGSAPGSPDGAPRRTGGGPISRLLGLVATLGSWASGALLLLMAVMIAVTVVSRYLFGNPMTSLFEFSEYAVLAITMLTAPVLVRTNEHVQMNLLEEMLGPDHWLSRITSWLVAVVIVLVGGGMCWFALQTFLNDVTTGATTTSFLAPPRWPLTALVVLGFLGVLIEAVRRVIHLFAGRGAEDQVEHLPTGL